MDWSCTIPGASLTISGNEYLWSGFYETLDPGQTGQLVFTAMITTDTVGTILYNTVEILTGAYPDNHT
jgi:hypothetical protein